MNAVFFVGVSGFWVGFGASHIGEKQSRDSAVTYSIRKTEVLDSISSICIAVQ